MPVNVLENAHLLEESLRNSVEFLQLKELYKELQKDEEAKQLFDQFRGIQLKLQEKQMANMPIEEEEVIQAQQLVAAVQQNEKIVALMEAEQKMSNVIMEINKIVMKPLEKLYSGQED